MCNRILLPPLIANEGRQNLDSTYDLEFEDEYRLSMLRSERKQ